MKQQIRNNVFETNSSSVHTLTMCNDSDYMKWVQQEMFFDYECGRLISKEEAKKVIDKDKENQKDLSQNGGDVYRFLTFDDFFNNYDALEYETYHDYFTTPYGELVHAFGYFGHD